MPFESESNSAFELFDLTPVGILVLDSEYRILFWNRCLENWTDTPRAAMLGCDARTMLPMLNGPAYARRIKDVFLNGVPAVFSPQLHPALIPCEIRPGEPRVQYVTIASLPSGTGGFQAVLSIQDITDLTRRLEESRNNTKRLAAELMERKQLEADLYRAKDAAERANSAKSQFLTVMTHEMRTPLHGVLGMTELLLHTDLSEEQRPMMQTIDDSGRLLLSLINELLDMAKIEAGRLMLEQVEFELRRTIEDTVKLVRPQALRKNLGVRCEIDPRVPERGVGDPTRVRQVLINLLGNAAKFTERGEILLRASCKPETGAGPCVLFEVTDTGVGIEESQLESLFQPFVQAESSTARKYGGTGLGLTISKRLVEMMGGTIGAESRLGEGSRFWFSVTFGAAAEAAPPAPTDDCGCPAAEPSGPAAHVLVADDNAVNRMVTTKMLGKLGYRTRTVENGLEVLAALQADKYDVILMDCLMPEMDGYHATAEIRRRESECEHIPIIALTASMDPEGRAQSLAAGMDGFLSKPMTLQRLSAVLKQFVQQS